MVDGWRSDSPAAFRFTLKVLKTITHKKQLQDCEKDVEEFVAAIEPLGEKLPAPCCRWAATSIAEQFSSLEAFLEILDPFLANWPHTAAPRRSRRVQPRWVVPELDRASCDGATRHWP